MGVDGTLGGSFEAYRPNTVGVESEDTGFLGCDLNNNPVFYPAASRTDEDTRLTVQVVDTLPDEPSQGDIILVEEWIEY
jgi:hypothetical protein